MYTGRICYPFPPLHIVIITHHVWHRTSFRIGIPIVSRIRSSSYICGGAPLLSVSCTRPSTRSLAIHDCSCPFMLSHPHAASLSFSPCVCSFSVLKYLFPSSSTVDHLFVSRRHTCHLGCAAGYPFPPLHLRFLGLSQEISPSDHVHAVSRTPVTLYSSIFSSPVSRPERTPRTCMQKIRSIPFSSMWWYIS